MARDDLGGASLWHPLPRGAEFVEQDATRVAP